MKTQNSVSRKIRMLHKINKKKDILNRNVRLLKSMLISMNSILGWASCSGVMEAQVALKAAFRSSALLGLVSLIFLLTIPHRFSMAAVLNSSPRAPPLCAFLMLLLSLQTFVLIDRKCPAKWTSHDIPP